MKRDEGGRINQESSGRMKTLFLVAAFIFLSTSFKGFSKHYVAASSATSLEIPVTITVFAEND